MVHDNTSLAAMAEALGRSTDYRVLRRLIPRTTFTPSVSETKKTGILLDTETTGLDPRKDEVIELGMVKFDYLPDGRVVGVRDVFSSFNEPSVPIPTEVTALTGITDEMVAGQRIDEAVVSAFVEDAVIVIDTTPASTGNSPSVTGRFSSGEPGAAPRPRSSGANTASKVRASATF